MRPRDARPSTTHCRPLACTRPQERGALMRAPRCRVSGKPRPGVACNQALSGRAKRACAPLRHRWAARRPTRAMRASITVQKACSELYSNVENITNTLKEGRRRPCASSRRNGVLVNGERRLRRALRSGFQSPLPVPHLVNCDIADRRSARTVSSVAMLCRRRGVPRGRVPDRRTAHQPRNRRNEAERSVHVDHTTRADLLDEYAERECQHRIPCGRA